MFQEAGTLSGGEKTKLALAMLMVGRNNLLLLDEPTNNLDPGSRQSVADALGDWPGAIIFVSHDTEFVEQLAPTKVLLLPDGDVDYFGPGWLDLVACWPRDRRTRVRCGWRRRPSADARRDHRVAADGAEAVADSRGARRGSRHVPDAHRGVRRDHQRRDDRRRGRRGAARRGSRGSRPTGRRRSSATTP